MPMPQLTDRIKEAPATVLRAIFAGVGQLLLAVDKIRNEVLDHEHASDGTGQPATVQPATQQEARQEAGNVSALREEPAAAPEPAQPAATGPAATAEPEAAQPEAAQPEAATGTRPAAKRAAARPAAAKPAAARKPAASKPATARAAGAAGAARPAAPAKPAGGTTPPLPGYDELSIASLRARMRGLDAAGVRALLEYEQANAGREAVMAMFERRLAKIAEAD